MAQSVEFNLNQPQNGHFYEPIHPPIPDNDIHELHSEDTFDLRHANNPLLVPPAKTCLSDGKITRVNDHYIFGLISLAHKFLKVLATTLTLVEPTKGLTDLMFTWSIFLKIKKKLWRLSITEMPCPFAPAI